MLRTTTIVAVPWFKLSFPIYGEVKQIINNPCWYPTERYRKAYFKTHGIKLPKVIPPGDPRNAMGKAKIIIRYIKPKITKPYRIHGTNEPETIGKRISSGCIRMLKKDILELIKIIGNKKTRVIFQE